MSFPQLPVQLANNVSELTSQGQILIPTPRLLILLVVDVTASD